MQIEVKLFAVARQLSGQDSVFVELTEPTVGGLRTALAEQIPALVPVLPTITFAVNAQYAVDSTPLTPDSEVACIPPVSGG